ncbi:MAG: exonuclease SbcC [Xanthobacteraceae bacterium]|nr:MAG: exonuclease SbcC [Xanthobacteraceae bacterium]
MVRKAALAESLGSIDCEIAPFLAAADLTIEALDADPTNVAIRLSAVAQEYDALRKQVGRSE